ncbi:MAG: MFS transporter [Terriglobia bacterium]
MIALQQIDNQAHLTRNQKLLVVTVVVAAALEFFDYYIVAFVLAFITKPWHLTFGLSAVILLSSGIGGIAGAFIWGIIADRWGRRPTFIATILTFSAGSVLLALTPTGAWIYLSLLRLAVGFGVGGFVVNMTFVQEFVPARVRGFVSSLASVFIPVGLMFGAFLGAYLAPVIGWRGMFLVGACPAFLTLLLIFIIPESPLWLLRSGKREEARRSIAWALQRDATEVDLGNVILKEPPRPRLRELFRYRRSLIASWMGNLGALTGYYGLILWLPTVLVLVLSTTAAHASALVISLSAIGVAARFAFGYLSDRIGRRACGFIFGIGAGILLPLAGTSASLHIGTVSLFWLLLIAAFVFADGGFAINGPYSAELWPSHLRATGMGSAYGFGSLGKIIGPLGLALIVGSSNFIEPAAMLGAIKPAFLYLGSWYAVAGVAYGIFGFETKGRTYEQIDDILQHKSSVMQSARISKHDAEAATPRIEK